MGVCKRGIKTRIELGHMDRAIGPLKIEIWKIDVGFDILSSSCMGC